MFDWTSRRTVLQGLLIAPVALAAPPVLGKSEVQNALSVSAAYDALLGDRLRIVDVRTSKEWQSTGVGAGVWPISMHESGFTARLFAARKMSAGRPVGIICATGGRSATVLQWLARSDHVGFVDIPEGMLGSESGPGWLATGLPVVSMAQAISTLPDELG
ncbi:rhodanese-like domain-containing protein [Seohaeicola saemankumensis]|nr:rhodanese-like domain-containing protein [Seohaeicola saemankumensis]MCA0871395.1 rhodanese-like domain-containing protein [Seohaeicola saemankumensis]